MKALEKKDRMADQGKIWLFWQIDWTEKILQYLCFFSLTYLLLEKGKAPEVTILYAVFMEASARDGAKSVHLRHHVAVYGWICGDLKFFRNSFFHKPFLVLICCSSFHSPNGFEYCTTFLWGSFWASMCVVRCICLPQGRLKHCLRTYFTFIAVFGVNVLTCCISAKQKRNGE